LMSPGKDLADMKQSHALLLGLLIFAGCGRSEPQFHGERPAEQRQFKGGGPADGPDAADMGGPAELRGAAGLLALNAPRAPGQAKAAAPMPAEPLPRKIVRNATIKVIVDDFAKAEEELRKLLAAEAGAYVARAEITGSPGAPRHGEWIIRVPIVQFD